MTESRTAKLCLPSHHAGPGLLHICSRSRVDLTLGQEPHPHSHPWSVPTWWHNESPAIVVVFSLRPLVHCHPHIPAAAPQVSSYVTYKGIIQHSKGDCGTLSLFISLPCGIVSLFLLKYMLTSASGYSQLYLPQQLGCWIACSALYKRKVHLSNVAGVQQGAGLSDSCHCSRAVSHPSFMSIGTTLDAKCSFLPPHSGCVLCHC